MFCINCIFLAENIRRVRQINKCYNILNSRALQTSSSEGKKLLQRAQVCKFHKSRGVFLSQSPMAATWAVFRLIYS